MTNDELKAEHRRLRMQTAALKREHDELEPGPDCAEHRRRLQRQIAELREHKKRLTARGVSDT